MIGLVFQEELMLIKQMHQKKNVIFVSIGILKILILSVSHIIPMVVMILQKAISFHDVAIANVQGSAYRIHFWYIRKNDAFRIINNSNLVYKKAVHILFICIYKKYQKNSRVAKNLK